MTVERAIDVGGVVDDPEEVYDGPVLVIFAVDPGVTTGWSALKVPVGLLAGLGVARTLARCRHRHGQVGRSGGVRVSGGGGSYSNTDSKHVSDLLDVARKIHEDWMPTWEDCEVCGGTGEDPDVSKRDTPCVAESCYYCEGEGGEWDVDNPQDFKFAFVLEGFDLRESSMDANLLAPVRVNSILCDRLAMAESESRIFFQSASDAKNTVTDERLRRWLMYDRNSGAHARDADRHATLLLRRFTADRDLRVRIFGHDPLATDYEGGGGV
jgi:hypothetical protein